MKIRLPNSPVRYDREDQDRLRRALEAAFEGLKLDFSGGGTGVLSVKYGDAAFALGIATIDWASADFTLTHSPVGELNVAISTSISRVGHVHDAADVTTGIFVRARLPSQIAYEDEANTFSLAQTFSTAAAFNAAGAPFTVAGTTLVTNLNADLLDGQHGSFYQNADNLNAGNLAYARLPTGGGIWANGGGLTLTGGDLTLGPNSNANVSIRIRSQGNSTVTGHAFLWLEGDISNDATEAGGAYVLMTQDNGLVSGIVGMTQSNALPDRAAYTGAVGNSLIIAGKTANERIQFGTNGTIRWQIDTGGALIGGTDPGGGEMLRVGGSLTVGDGTKRLSLDPTNQFVGSITNHNFSLVTNNVTKWTVQTGGHFVAGVDNTYDIGASGATRPRTGYFGTSLIVGTDPSGSESVRVGGDILLSNNSSFKGRTTGGSNIRLVQLASDDNVYIGAIDALAGSVRLRTNGSNRWDWTSAGHYLAVTDNTLDIGASGATRPRTGYFGTGIIVGTDPGSTETVRIGGTLRVGNTNTAFAAGTGIILAHTAASGANINQIAGGRVDNTFTDTSQAADEKRWDISMGGVGGPKSFSFVTRTDAGGAGTQWLKAVRGTGTAITSVEILTDGPGAFRTTNVTTLGDSGNRWGKLWTTSADISTIALVTGDLTLGARLIFSAAAAKIVPGATSLSHRNNADSADNLLIADNGDLTGRTKLTMPGPLMLTTAASKIVPGATSISLRNNADNADNLLITDAGVATLRNQLRIVRVGNEPSVHFERDLANNPRWDIGRMNSTSFRFVYADDVTTEFQAMTLSAGGVLTGYDTASVARWSLGSSGTATGFELGRQDGTTASSFIDFHTSATAVDYDFRLIASGNPGVIAGGTLSLVGAVLQYQSTSGNNRAVFTDTLHTFAVPVSVTGGKLLVDGTDSTLASGEIGLVENSGELWMGARSVLRLLMDDDNTGTGSVVISKGTQASPTHLLTFDQVGVMNWNTTDVVLQRAGSTRLSATATLLTSAGDFAIGSLGTFDSTDTPTDGQLLLYHAGGINKWQAESLQLIYNAGDAAVALLTDNTSTQFLYFDPGAGADSPVGAPPVPVLKLFATHKGVTVAAYASTGPDVFYHDGPSYPADFRHFLYEYSLDNFGTAAKALATASSDKVNHGRLTVGTTYYYRARAVDRAGNASANSAVVSFTAVASSDTTNFGVVLATEIAVDRLAALSADIGIITAGQLRNAGNTAGVNLGGAGGIPGTWTSGISFENTAWPSTAYMTLDFFARLLTIKDEQATPKTRVKLGEVNTATTDWGLQIFADNGNKIVELTGTSLFIQDSAATPTQGINIQGTVPASWTRYLNLNGSGSMLKHDKLDLKYDGSAMFKGGIDILDSQAPDTGVDYHIVLRDSGVAHGMTTLVSTNVFATIDTAGASGGLALSAYTGATNAAFLLTGIVTGAATGVFQLKALKKSGTSSTVLGAGETALLVDDGTGFPLQVMAQRGIKVQDGDAAHPGYAFNGSDAAGMWFSSSTVRFSVGGSEVVSFSAATASFTGDGAFTGKVTSKIAGSSSIGPVSHALFGISGATTTSTADVSVTSYNVPANVLNTNGNVIVARGNGIHGAVAGGRIILKWGAQTIFNIVSGTGGATWSFVINIMRTGSNTQSVWYQYYEAGGLVGEATLNGTQTDTAQILLDLRSDQAGAGTFTVTQWNGFVLEL